MPSSVVLGKPGPKDGRNIPDSTKGEKSQGMVGMNSRACTISRAVADVPVAENHAKSGC